MGIFLIFLKFSFALEEDPWPCHRCPELPGIHSNLGSSCSFSISKLPEIFGTTISFDPRFSPGDPFALPTGSALRGSPTPPTQAQPSPGPDIPWKPLIPVLLLPGRRLAGIWRDFPADPDGKYAIICLQDALGRVILWEAAEPLEFKHNVHRIVLYSAPPEFFWREEVLLRFYGTLGMGATLESFLRLGNKFFYLKENFPGCLPHFGGFSKYPGFPERFQICFPAGALRRRVSKEVFLLEEGENVEFFPAREGFADGGKEHKGWIPGGNDSG